MDPELCPPWWPELLWWLLHHPHGPEPPEPGEWLKRPTEELLVGLATYVQAQTFLAKQGELREQVAQAALERMNGAVEQLAKGARD